MPSIKVQNNSRMEIEITDWRFLVKELRKIDPRLVGRFKRKAREIGKPVQNAIKKAIPKKIDIKGMQPKVIPGRMTWGGPIAAGKTTMKVDTRIKKRGRSIVSVWVWSPAVSMLDMAKNAGRSDGKSTREYPYSKSASGKRRHRVNGQGEGLLKAASNSGKLIRADEPSRMIWPATYKALPEVNAQLDKLIESESIRINAIMRRKQ